MYTYVLTHFPHPCAHFVDCIEAHTNFGREIFFLQTDLPMYGSVIAELDSNQLLVGAASRHAFETQIRELQKQVSCPRASLLMQCLVAPADLALSHGPDVFCFPSLPPLLLHTSHCPSSSC